ncbi:MAG: hypothetical protein JSW42_01850, partial [Chloroflexota bacterium]
DLFENKIDVNVCYLRHVCILSDIQKFYSNPKTLIIGFYPDSIPKFFNYSLFSKRIKDTAFLLKWDCEIDERITSFREKTVLRHP